MNGDDEGRSVLEALELLLEPGGVAELRAIGADGRVSSGYFDSPAGLAAAAEVLDDAAESAGIYATLNPVTPALLARRANRVKRRLGPKDATTADGDILSRRWLPIDVDPVRPSGVSATADEHREACAVARAIRDALGAAGWTAPIAADSGNGCHLLYRVDLPNDDDSTALVKGVLAALDERFSTESAKVDTANFNAARIWKCYGTVSRKGDSTADRPHRRSAIVSRPDEPEAVSADRLRALIAESPAAPGRRPAAPAIAADRDPAFDLRRWLDTHGIGVASEKAWRGGTLYTLAQCPFSDAHTDGAYAIRFPNGAVHAGCKHESCGGGRQRWKELRARFEPPPAGRTDAAAPALASPEPDPDVAATAKEVLERGDPVRYFLDCFAGDHVGDTALAHCLVMSIASQAVRNSNGLHVYVTGETGKGKSSGMTAMLKQVPEEFRLAERMSNKALYYSDDINPGTVFLLDDIALSGELQEVLKEATTHFTERVRMRVVNKDRRIQFCTIPERCAWWLANVSALYDEQVLNRTLVCWVDDSEEQDAEVFRRKMAAQSLPPAEAIADRFALRVSRELWRQLRAEGLVFVRIPFAERIRMASVRNRRNPDILLDLIRSHALCRCRQRERERLPDGGLLVTATEEDFRYAAGVFASLHGTGGSLSAKFDRNEALVLALAVKNGVEQFSVADVQGWTGWAYAKTRRLLLGYVDRGVHYPGLIDRSPALSVVDQTVTIQDQDGRDIRRRAHVFTFDAALHRRSAPAGEVWLAPERAPAGSAPSVDEFGSPAVNGYGHEAGDRSGSGTANGENCVGIDLSVVVHGDHIQCETHQCDSQCDAQNETPTPAGSKDSTGPALADSPGPASVRFSTADGAASRTALAGIDPHDFLTLDGPTFEPCSACGGKPSYYREKWRKGMAERRRLCRRCYDTAVRRAQAAVEPLPRAIAPAAMERIAASVGRCDVCGLERAAWKGQGVRLCDACYQRESRRAVEAGMEVVV